MKVYVASSWRNAMQPSVVTALVVAGHEVYDFREPTPGDRGFHWSDIDPDWKAWSPAQFRDALVHPLVERGFDNDWRALEWCDVCVLLLPCGRSAHLEAGVCRGAGKRVIVLLADGEPEIMYKMFHTIALSIDDAVHALGEFQRVFDGGE